MLNHSLKYMIPLVLTLLFAAGCARKEAAHEEDGHGHGHGHGGVAVTEWQDSLELFAEWPSFVVGRASEAVLHFTDLRTFEPAIDGPLEVSWVQNGSTLKTEPAIRCEWRRQ